MVRKIRSTFPAVLVLALLSVVVPGRAQDAGDPDSPARWIGANEIFIAPTTADLYGAGFTPGVVLWLDVTDPLGSVVTSQVAADDDGKLIAEIAVDQPGIYVARVRDGNGQVLAEGEVFVGVD